VLFGFFADWYYLFPRITGYAFSETLGMIGVNTALAAQPLLASGFVGRLVNAPDWVRGSNLVSWIGSYIAAAGILVFFFNYGTLVLAETPGRVKPSVEPECPTRGTHAWRDIGRNLAGAAWRETCRVASPAQHPAVPHKSRHRPSWTSFGYS